MTGKKVAELKKEEPMRSANSSNNVRIRVWYGVCQKNQAAAVGGYALDGCLEFMASDAEGTEEPEILFRKNMSRMKVVILKNPPNNVRMRVRYRGCKKNHAVKLGKYALDGCGEFMASGEEGTRGAMICDACNCHRNFHKRVMVSENV
ncbi:ZF-HD homeobox protein, Cys/His-rich dimerization domain-containing protein [Cynara cardunculus var. scolymus]|uniref:ZF-HD homeobox protein, Cys/His-rich dimerization domain-containing protein n=1 Tax=Cynara cardunculus var. scolymus TaxID=59895 RepID=A0A103YHC2_CYNCS|nr:ZF-HD homeobox protein, Cys/His-rich dimerization domain-containing protein [Cynara cardunculus var. scolymus]